MFGGYPYLPSGGLQDCTSREAGYNHKSARSLTLFVNAIANERDPARVFGGIDAPDFVTLKNPRARDAPHRCDLDRSDRFMNPPFPQPIRGAHSRPEGGQPEPETNLVPLALRETVLLSLALVLYLFVRNVIRDEPEAAFQNAQRIIDLERWLGIFWEPTIQTWAMARDWVITVANWVYVWAYWPTLAGTMLWLFLRHRQVLSLYRNALLISGAIGLVGFATFPLAPPRFLSGYGFVDTVGNRSEAYATLYPSSVANWYAAMPSLHVGWTLLMGIALVRQSPSMPTRLLGIALPVAMFVATVLTANHYLADGVVGAVVALVGLMLAYLMRRLHQRRQVRSDMRSF